MTVDLAEPGQDQGDAAVDSYVNIRALGTNFADKIGRDNSGDVLEGGYGADILLGGAADTLTGNGWADWRR